MPASPCKDDGNGSKSDEKHHRRQNYPPPAPRLVSVTKPKSHQNKVDQYGCRSEPRWKHSRPAHCLRIVQGSPKPAPQDSPNIDEPLLHGFSEAQRPNIGNPKLFNVGEESAAKISPQPTVNNSSPRKNRGPIRMARTWSFHYPCLWFFRTGVPGLQRPSTFNDFELIDRPTGAALTL